MINQNELQNSKKNIPKFDLHLKGAYEQPGRTAKYAALFGSWALVGVCLIASILAGVINWALACLSLFFTLAFAGYLRRVERTLETLESSTYDLRINSMFVKIKVFNSKTGQHVEDEMRLRDICWAEFYHCDDEPIVVLRSRNCFIEIPLLPFGSQKSEILKQLTSRQIPMLCVS